jgi:hypothetical protein
LAFIDSWYPPIFKPFGEQCFGITGPPVRLIFFSFDDDMGSEGGEMKDRMNQWEAMMEVGRR